MERKSPYIVYLSKMAIKTKFRNRGLARALGSQAIFNALRFNVFKDTRRLDSDVRSSQINAQKFAEKIRSYSFSFIPSFYTYGDRTNLKVDANVPYHSGDRTNLKVDANVPYQGGKRESAFLYCTFLRDFWKIRSKEVYLLKNKNIQYYYNYVKNKIFYMKKDKLILRKSGNPLEIDHNKFEIHKDNFKGIVTLTGTINSNTIKELIPKFQKWRMIIWNVPATKKGLFSQKIALKNSFIPIGHNIGSTHIIENGKEKLIDSVCFLKFNEKVESEQFNKIEYTITNLDLVSKVIDLIPKNKRKYDMVFSSLLHNQNKS